MLGGQPLLSACSRTPEVRATLLRQVVAAAYGRIGKSRPFPIQFGMIVISLMLLKKSEKQNVLNCAQSARTSFALQPLYIFIRMTLGGFG
jgi:hypothetical protein